MKKILSIILIICLVGCTNTSDWNQISVDQTIVKKTIGVWVSYLDLTEMIKNKSEEQFTEQVKDMINNLEALGANKIYAQASAFTDAFYDSQYYPYSAYCGKLGKNPGYDPLGIIVTEAALRNIEVEAWINPFRSLTLKEMKALDDRYLLKQWYLADNNNLMYINDRYYLNPGSNEAIELISKVAQELLDNYQIVGIHIDDYFYPSGISDADDQKTYDEYLLLNPEKTREEYRLECCDNLVKTLNAICGKRIFSISPNAKIETNRNEYYCDVEKWISDRIYCDQMIPQVYFGFENETMPFEEVVDKWLSISNGEVNLLFGLAAYKVGDIDKYAGEGKNEWVDNADILARQAQYIKKKSSRIGLVLFRYNMMFYPSKTKFKQMQMELTKLKKILGESNA